MSTRWTPEHYDACEKRQSGKRAIVDTRRHAIVEHNANAAAIAMTRPESGSPTKAEAKAEKELHGLISAELRRREIRFLHADMRKASTLPVGHPDYTIW